MKQRYFTHFDRALCKKTIKTKFPRLNNNKFTTCIQNVLNIITLKFVRGLQSIIHCNYSYFCSGVTLFRVTPETQTNRNF